MSARPLPVGANLAHLKHQAKDLLKAHRAADAVAVGRIREFLPRCQGASLESIVQGQFQLSDALFVIAREYGFGDWPALKRQLTSGGDASSAVEPPIDFEPFKTAIEGGAVD
jgi:hypothetical protein